MAALLQQYGGLMEVELDPSSGRISPVPGVGQQPVQLFEYPDFRDGGCYFPARRYDTLATNVHKLSGMGGGVMLVNQIQGAHCPSLTIAVADNQ